MKYSWNTVLILTLANVLMHTTMIGAGVFDGEAQSSFVNSFLAGLVLFIVVLPSPFYLLAGLVNAIKKAPFLSQIMTSMVRFQLCMLLIQLVVLIKELVFFL